MMRRTPLARKSRLARRARLTYRPRRIPALVRMEVRLRAGGWCERCGAQGHHLHHRRPRSRGGADTADNLVLLCWRCHAWVHDHPAQAKAEGWLA